MSETFPYSKRNPAREKNCRNVYAYAHRYRKDIPYTRPHLYSRT